VENVNYLLSLLGYGDRNDDGRMYKYKRWDNRIERSEEDKGIKRKEKWMNRKDENVLN
jgi:hypothetical protein